MKRVRRYVLEVAETPLIQPRHVQQVGEQPLVHAVPATAAVLVEFDRDECRLGLPRQSRDRPRVRVALLEVIQRAMHEVLPHLLPRAAVAQVVRRSRSVDRLDRERLHLVGRHTSGPISPTSRRTAVRNAPLESAAQLQQAGIPLPSRVDAREAAVVQLVADVERQLQIQPVWIGFADRCGHPGELPLGRATRQERSRTVDDTAPAGDGRAGSIAVAARVTSQAVPG